MEYAYAGGASADTGSTFGLSGAALKWIAMISMLIDHIGAVVVEYGLYYQGGAECFQKLLENGNGQWLYVLQRGMRMLGRPAFLIYAFLLVEGFYHTHSRRRYALQMFLFALISELPFDLAAANRWFYPGYQNVFFEFLIGLAVLWGMEQAQFREKTPLAVEAGKIFAVLGGLETLELNYGVGALAAIPIWFYNGKRGKQKFKYVFYWFYPVHLTVLVLIRAGFLGIFPW